MFSLHLVRLGQGLRLIGVTQSDIGIRRKPFALSGHLRVAFHYGLSIQKSVVGSNYMEGIEMETKPENGLSASETERINRNREAVYRLLPEMVPFIKELQQLGMIEGWRAIESVRPTTDEEKADWAAGLARAGAVSNAVQEGTLQTLGSVDRMTLDLGTFKNDVELDRAIGAVVKIHPRHLTIAGTDRDEATRIGKRIAAAGHRPLSMKFRKVA